MPNNIKTIFFDLGGVVYNFKRGFEILAKAVDRPQEDVEAVYRKQAFLAGKGKINSQQFWVNIREDLNLMEDTSIKDYFGYWINTFSRNSETHTLIHELAGNYTLGLITNIETGVFEAVVDKGVVPHVDFRAVIKSCDVGFVKPEKEIYLLAQDKVKSEANEILFIDDYQENIDAAISLGWHGLVFDEHNIHKSVQRIKEYLATSKPDSD